MQRRQFIGSLARLGVAGTAGATGILGLGGCGARPRSLPPGELLGMDFNLGHRLRQQDFPAPTTTGNTRVLIVGAGIAGLSAAWQLDKAGQDDYLLLELECDAGGNSRYGQNAISAYPWGAHYLPLPGSEAHEVRELLAELGALHGDPHAPRPVYDETLLCHSPHERVFKDGLWEEGLLPQLGISAAERGQYQRFFARMADYRQVRDKQGKRAFALPVHRASTDPAWLALDRLTMHDWLMQEGFDAPALHAYINYTCRDDYGTDYRRTSAWAGIHYFACRNGEAANASSDSVLTAPEGNGWLVRALHQKAASRVQTQTLTYRLQRHKHGWTARVFDARRGESHTIEARQVIWAAPLFLLPQVLEGMPAAWHRAITPIQRAPWLVANLSLSALPQHTVGASLAWDNVFYDAAGTQGLGYIVATHQQLRQHPQASVLTYYNALSSLAPVAARQQLLNTDHATWTRQILAELGRAHRDLPELVTRIDIFRHGHAMPCPLPGQFSDGRRQVLMQSWQGLHLAHSDIGHLSLFEEANFWGMRAARQVMGQALSR